MVMQLKNTREEKNGRNNRMRELRLMFGLTQKQFAESLGMSREGYQKIERGENNLSLDVLESMKKVYGISSDYLLYGDLKDTETAWELLQDCSEYTKFEIVIRLIQYFTASRNLSSIGDAFGVEEFVGEIANRGNQKE